MTEKDCTQFVDQLVQRIGRERHNTIALLQGIQQQYRYLPPAALERLCEVSDITPAGIAGVSTFYSQFRHTPAGKHTIAVCHGTACHVKGAPAVTDAVRRMLGISEEDDTSPDGLFTVEKVACLGCCTLAPAVKIDEITYGHQNPDTIDDMINDFLRRVDQDQAAPVPPDPGDGPAGEILLGLGSCCISRGSGDVKHAVDMALAETGARARVKRVGCVGMCHKTPLVDIVTPGGEKFRYAEVDANDARRIVLTHFSPQGAGRSIMASITGCLEKLLTDESWKSVRGYLVPPRDGQVQQFLGPQKHIVTEYFGFLDPVDFEEYRQLGGFSALKKCLGELSPDQIVETVASSALRGRGGAGYPTGQKWSAVRESPGEKKYIVCNGDEGDPGAFMDRMLLESFPYRIIEGMTIAARAVGADEGVLYIRAEYPLAVDRVESAIARCKEEGLLGEDILGSGFSLNLRIMEGAGAFVCGEETALLESIEGSRGMPRLRPPYPSASGLWGKPTLVNNVETYANIPWIFIHSADDFASCGTDNSRGTKVFALAGKINRGGLIEVPMGMTIRQIVDDIGGGIQNDKELKAVQIGGPSGGCVPESMADTPVDYHALTEAGAIMGSGGLVVLDEDDCMVEIARYFLEFTQDQSCGKCTFCRIGTRRMLEILEGLCGGTAKKGDLEKLETLAENIQRGSLCQLGGTAPNPVISTLKHFRSEYEAHIEGRCPAGKCQALITFSITDECIGCTKCAQACPVGAIECRPLEQHEIDTERCVRCGGCAAACPVGAVKVE